MEEIWRFIDTGALSPALNMAIDEAILQFHGEGKVPPTLRFYTWNPATLSIGYFQRAEKEIDFNRLKEEGIGFVRRPTGGRAVLHDKELTYSIVVAEGYPGIPATVTDSYRFFSLGLMEGFRQLGLPVEMVKLDSESEKGKQASLGTAACFDSPSWYELVLGERKIAGSAQMRQRGVILQHGSILIDLDADLLFSLLRFPSEEVRQRGKRLFLKRAVAINEERIHSPATLEEVKGAFAEGFRKGLGIRLIEGELTKEEWSLAERLVQEKYGTDAWNHRR
ncbi:MAG: lipoate--protein ligase family protein [Thermicanus sp.]|nr:lipoate--protein ligase family protein [Thermicanus sp.]